MNNIIFEINNNIGYITVNRPEVLNCFDYATLAELQKIVDEIHINKEIKVVIFTGSGNKAFCAGADLKERRTLEEVEVNRNVKAIRMVFNSIAALPQPTIAAVNGYALGGGFEWLLSCDFAIGVDDTLVGLTETSWGIIPGAGGTQRLPRIVGESKAKELIFTAKRITSQEAESLGIFIKIVPQSKLQSTCEEFALEMMRNAPIALKQAKFAINQGLNTDIQTGIKIEEKAYEITVPTSDRIEALDAFKDKREPQFTGK